MVPGSLPFPARLPVAALLAVLCAWAAAPQQVRAASAAPGVQLTRSGGTLDLDLRVKTTDTARRPRAVRIERGRIRVTLRHRGTRRVRGAARILTRWRATVPRQDRGRVLALEGRAVTVVLRWKGGRSTRLRRTLRLRADAPGRTAPSAAPAPTATPGRVPSPVPGASAVAPSPAVAPVPPAPTATPAPTAPTATPAPTGMPVPSATPTRRVLPVTGQGGSSIGDLELSGTRSATQASAQSASRVTIPAGPVRITSCLRVEVPGTAGARSCRREELDGAEPRTVAAPTVETELPTAGADGTQGFAQGLTQVDTRVAGTWTRYATSPPGGIDAAAVPLPVPGIAADPLPKLLVTPFSGAPDYFGGVDTGAPEAFCAGVDAGPAVPPPSGVTLLGLGDPAPALHEVAEPTTGGPARGVMVLLHGGGWYTQGPAAVSWSRGDADRWRARGWRTVSATYRPCGEAVDDALWVVDRALAAAGRLPVCVAGVSAGAHLALLAAARRPAVACAIGYGAPTDLVTVGGQRTSTGDDPAVGDPDGPRWVANLAIAAFGRANLADISPARHPIAARILLATARNDWAVPWEQATELRDAQRFREPDAYVDAVRLDPGSVPWVHGSASPAALEDLRAREEALVAPLATP